MKISIITVSYNSSDTIQETIESVLSQQDCNIEYIVVDGKSKDGTVDIIKKNEPRFNGRMRWISEPDQGIYDALNKGIRLATGDIIGFLHSDDVFASSSVIKTIQETFEKTNADIAYGDLIYLDNKNQGKVLRYWKSQPFSLSLLFRGWMPAHPTVFMKKEIYEKQGGYDVSFSISADYDFMLRVLKDISLHYVYLPQVITKMSMGGVSNRNLSNIIVKSKEDYRALRKNGFSYAWWILAMKNISKLTQFLQW
jgi:glycosyltransferase involved in cell wall biosynthesis